MSTALAEIKPPTDDFVITTSIEVIDGLRKRASEYKLAGIEVKDGKVIVKDSAALLADKEGLKALKKFITQEVVKQRTACEKEHKKIKEDAWAECKRIDKWKNDMLALIREIEEPLCAIEKAVEDELDRIAQEHADKKYAARKAALILLGAVEDEIDEAVIRRMDEDAFHREGNRVSAVKARKFAEEQERLRIAEEHRKESERLAAERAAFEEQQKESNRLAQIERDKIASELAESQRLAKVESDRLAALLADQQKMMREQQEALDRQKAEHDSLVRRQQDAMEAERLAEQNRIAEREADIQRQQEEMERQRRLQNEEADRLLAIQQAHENEIAEREFQERYAAEQAAKEEILAPYEALPEIPEVYAGPWHIVAAKEVCEWINERGGMAPIDDDDVETVSDIILEAYTARTV